MIMAKKKTTDVAEKIPPRTSPFEPGGNPLPETNGEHKGPQPRTGEKRNGEQGGSERKPLKVLSYQVNHDVYVQASVWDRLATRRDGVSFTAYDASVRKRWLDPDTGEWRSAYSFSANELYAVVHALQAAAAVILELRAAEIPF
jgi:hypothetical protein